jgi:nucleoside-diphosphate-sugar epimerase
MNIAVTGASGFIGRHVIAELANKSTTITAVTRDAQNLAGMDSTVRIVEMDISNPPLNAFDLLGQPNVLIHLAWDGLPNYYSSHHFESELPNQFRFLKQLIESGLNSLLVSGTCFEYGMQSGGLKETLISTPNNAYGYAKNALRQQLEFLQREHTFELTWTRLFYMYGDGQGERSLLPLIESAVKRGDEVFNMSGGDQLRDYLPVTQVASHLVTLALGRSEVGIINICSGEPISVRKLVAGWIDENDWQIKLNLGHYPYPEYEPMAFWGDATKLNNHLAR